MGRPKSEKPVDINKTPQLQASNKKRKSDIYKNKFQKKLGSSKTGHGFASVQKRKFLSKFRRKFKRNKKDDENEKPFEQPKPLADDGTSTRMDNTGNITTNDMRVNFADTSKNASIKEEATKIPHEDSGFSEESSMVLKRREFSGSTSLLNKLKRQSTYQQPEQPHQRIAIDYERIDKERKLKMEELQANKQRHDKFVKKNMEKRKKITKKLNKRTSRGQPVMSTRLEQILGKLTK